MDLITTAINLVQKISINAERDRDLKAKTFSCLRIATSTTTRSYTDLKDNFFLKLVSTKDVTAALR